MWGTWPHTHPPTPRHLSLSQIDGHLWITFIVQLLTKLSFTAHNRAWPTCTPPILACVRASEFEVQSVALV
jgi:hypothetical protein